MIFLLLAVDTVFDIVWCWLKVVSSSTVSAQFAGQMLFS
ncbi:MAG: hypothetical protein ACI9J5_001871, partial [Paraglaciecola sp.]